MAIPSPKIPPTPKIAQIFDDLGGGTIADANQALMRLDSHPPHPYIARRLTYLFFDPPFRSPSAKSLWTRISCQLFRHGDETTLSELEPLEGRYHEIISSSSMGPWMSSCLDELIALLRNPSTSDGFRRDRSRDFVDDLRAGADAISRGRNEEALGCLLRAFELTPHPSVAEAIEDLDHYNAHAVQTMSESQWLAAIEAADQGRMGYAKLIAPLTGAKARRLSRGLGVLCTQRADPRIGRVTVEALIASPSPPQGATALRFLEALSRHGDNRLISRLGAAVKKNIRLAYFVAVLTDRFSALPELTSEARDLIERIGERLAIARRKAVRDEAMGQDLLQAVYDEPDSREARLIYADWLLEQGDPRGELIALQCPFTKGAPRQVEVRRIEALLREHGEAWLGPLRPVVMKQGLRFARGFPASVRIRDCSLEIFKPLIGDLAWATIEEVDFTAPHVSRGMDHPAMRSLRAVGGMTIGHVRALARARPARVETLGLVIGLEGERALEVVADAFEELEALSNLRRLHISQRGPEDLLEQLLLRGAMKQLETLCVGHRHINPADLLSDVEHFLENLSTLTLETNFNASIQGATMGWTTSFRRDRAGSFKHLEARFIPSPNRPSFRGVGLLSEKVLSRLGRQLTSVSIDIAGEPTPSVEDLAELERTVSRYHRGARFEISTSTSDSKRDI